VDIANPDRETRRILRVGVPLTLAAVSQSFFNAVTVALISIYLGVDALTAFVVTNLLIGLSDTFIKGVAHSLNTVCSHAIGAENYDLAGQYVQIASLLYLAFAIPAMGVWWFLIDDCIRLFGMNEQVVQMGTEYTKVVIFEYVARGIFDAYTALLDINGHALPATIFDMITDAMGCGVTWVLMAYVDGFNLFWVAVTILSTTICCFIVFTLIAVCQGWLDPFWNGMINTCALKNTSAVKNVLNTAIPLAFGSLLEYGEVSCRLYKQAFLLRYQTLLIPFSFHDPAVGDTHIYRCSSGPR